MRPTRLVALGVLVVMPVATVACSTSAEGMPTATSSSSGGGATSTLSTSLPTRARSYDVTDVNPCALLTASQTATFGINLPPSGPRNNDPGISRCNFLISPSATSFGISLDTTRNTESIVGNATPSLSTTIDGVGALVIEGGALGCTYALDISDTQSLRVNSESLTSTSAADCPRAKALGEAVMTTLDFLQPS